jgi:hypothetical protein
MVTAMLLWTAEKGFLIFDTTAGIHQNVVVAVIWWAAYMHAFYLVVR